MLLALGANEQGFPFWTGARSPGVSLSLLINLFLNLLLGLGEWVCAPIF